MNYYNEHDPKAAAWLRELIRAGEIPAGDVDERSIEQVRPHELHGYVQQHFFAGIGGWSLALRLAGWPDSRPVRTGSCPCQPFSAAGKGLGEADKRHLWPVFRDLITFGAPAVTFGEQVASAAGRLWLAGVRADLEGVGYAVGAADLCAAGVGAPHIRQRLYWVADPTRERFTNGGRTNWTRRLADADGRESSDGDLQRGRQHGQQPPDRGAGGLGDSCRERSGRDAAAIPCSQGEGSSQRSSAVCLADEPVDAGEARRLGHTDISRPQGRELRSHEESAQRNPWSASALVECTDGKARRTQPGVHPLVDGVSGRVGLLRGYGNAIVPQVAAEFVRAYLEVSTHA